MPENNFVHALLPASDNVPIGTIVAWAGPSNLIPGGWLICNGDPIYQNQFPVLCGIIQDYWGPVDAVSGQHTLPDLRALFLRGINGSRSDLFSDPEIGNRVSSNHRPNDVGSVQLDAFQGHWHSFNWTHPPSYGGDNNTKRGDERNGHYVTNLQITDAVSDNRNGNPRISSETRSKNAYVYYIVKAAQ